MEIVVQAAREMGLPADYIGALRRWLRKQPLGPGQRRLHRDIGDIA
jgi:hypothetical protein